MKGELPQKAGVEKLQDGEEDHTADLIPAALLSLLLSGRKEKCNFFYLISL